MQRPWGGRYRYDEGTDRRPVQPQRVSKERKACEGPDRARPWWPRGRLCPYSEESGSHGRIASLLRYNSDTTVSTECRDSPYTCAVIHTIATIPSANTSFPSESSLLLFGSNSCSHPQPQGTPQGPSVSIALPFLKVS